MEKPNMLELLMTSMAVEAGMYVQAGLNDLVSKYKSAGIDVVPISELEELIQSGIKKCSESDSLTLKVMEGMNETNK